MPNPLPQQRFPVSPQPLGPLAVLMAACLTTIHPAQAQQPVRPLPYHSRCATGYVASGSYCLPAKGGNPRGALVKVGRGCPTGFTLSPLHKALQRSGSTKSTPNSVGGLPS